MAFRQRAAHENRSRSIVVHQGLQLLQRTADELYETAAATVDDHAWPIAWKQTLHFDGG